MLDISYHIKSQANIRLIKRNYNEMKCSYEDLKKIVIFDEKAVDEIKRSMS